MPKKLGGGHPLPNPPGRGNQMAASPQVSSPAARAYSSSDRLIPIPTVQGVRGGDDPPRPPEAFLLPSSFLSIRRSPCLASGVPSSYDPKKARRDVAREESMTQGPHDSGLRVQMDERYVSWIGKAEEIVAADTARADATFAARHKVSEPQPEQQQGRIANETA